MECALAKLDRFKASIPGNNVLDVSFSDAPLRLALWMGACVSVIAMLYGFYVFVERLMSTTYLPGWTSTMRYTCHSESNPGSAVRAAFQSAIFGSRPSSRASTAP